jgi:hypothetical protein
LGIFGGVWWQFSESHSESGDSLAAFATKSPDRCAQALILIAKLSGYSERHEVTTPPAGLLGFVRDLKAMPDGQLQKQLAALRAIDNNAH